MIRSDIHIKSNISSRWPLFCVCVCRLCVWVCGLCQRLCRCTAVNISHIHILILLWPGQLPEESTCHTHICTHTHMNTHTNVWLYSWPFPHVPILFSPFFLQPLCLWSPFLSQSLWLWQKHTHTQTHSRTHKMLINRQNKRENTHGRAAKKLTPEGIYWNYNDMNGYWEYNEPPSSLMKASREIAFDH